MYTGFGTLEATDETLDQIARTLSTKEGLTALDIATAFKVLDQDDRHSLAQKLMVRGVSTQLINSALQLLQVQMAPAQPPNWWEAKTPEQKRNFKIWSALSTISAAASAYHGYKRNQSIGWGVAWFFLGGLFPVLVPVIAVAQGYGKPK